MTEIIYVTYTTASASFAGGPVIGSHMVLNYIDANGVHRIIEGMPEKSFSSTAEKAKAFIKEELFSNGTKNTDSPFGRIVAEERFATDADAGRPHEVVSQGSDLSSKWNAIRDFKDAINDTGFEYRPRSQNSDTFGAGALGNAGLRATGEAIDPVTGAPVTMSTPGSDKVLTNPIHGVPDTEAPLERPGFDYTLNEDTTTGSITVTAVRQESTDDNIDSVSATLDVNGNLVNTETIRIDGTSTEVNYDVTGTETWAEQTVAYDNQGNESAVQTTFDDGSSLAVGYDQNGNTVWSESVDTAGNGTYTDANGTVIETSGNDGGVTIPGFTEDGNPSIEYHLPSENPVGSDECFTFSRDQDNDTVSVNLNDGTEFSIPASSEVSASSTGLAIPVVAPGSGPWGFDPPAGPEDPEDPFPPFGPEHPSPLENRDPLVVDLDGNGVQLSNVHDSNAHFDYGGSGFAPKTGWVSATDGILVHDVPVSGAVGADQMFGATSGNGFTDLAGFDTNSDGKIDSSDTNFSHLKVWQDVDGDGTADSGEILTLAEADITAINLNQQAAGTNVNGNIIVETATIVRGDNSTDTIAEVNFATDALYSRYTPPENFVYSQTAFLLPALVGYGHVPDLIYSMSLDPDLEDAVRDLVINASSMSGREFDTAFETLMQTWAGAADANPSGHGPLIDGRHLALVEAFYGTSYEQANGAGASLNQFTANGIEATYQAIVDELKVRFVAQASLSQLVNGASWASIENSPLLPFASIKFDHNSDGVTIDFDRVVLDLAHQAPADDAAKIGYFDFGARVIKSLRVDLFGERKDDLITAFEAAAVAVALDLGMRALVVAELQADHVLVASDFMGAVTGSSKADAILIDEAGHTVSGGAGADSYIYTKTATGNSTISDAGFHSDDALILADAVPADVTLSRTGASNDFVMTIAGGGTLTIDEQFQVDGYGAIETFRFADGTVWTAAGIRQMLLDQGEAASSGGIYGYDGVNDTIVAGLGDKYMSGLSGNDTYVYSLAGGNDTIDDRYWFSTDTLQLTDIDSGDVTLSRSGGSNDVVLTIAGGHTIAIKDQFETDGYGTIEQIHFADEVTWTAAQIKQMLLDQGEAASSGSIYGYQGSNDTIVAGLGDKYLAGLGGNDTYVYSLAGGNDTVDDRSYLSIDTLQFTDVDSTNITLSRAGASDDVVPTVNGGHSVTVLDQFDSNAFGRIESFTFADSVTWTAAQVRQMLLDQGTAASSGSIYGYGDSNDTIVAGLGNKYLSGLGGNDTYVYSAAGGNVTIEDASFGSSADAIHLTGIDPNGVTLSRSGSDLLVAVTGGHTLTVKSQFTSIGRIESFTFGDGTVLSDTDIASMATGSGLPVILGTTANETINGTSNAEIIDGVGGNDTLVGGDAGDVYLYRLGSGNDTIQDWGYYTGTDILQLIGLNIADLTFTRSANDLYVKINSSGETVKVEQQFSNSGVEQVKFEDTTAWNRSQILDASWIRGTSAGETIYGTGDADKIDGGGGNDTLIGDNNGDTYLYGVGSGNDAIQDWGYYAGADTLLLSGLNSGDVTFSRSGNDLFVKIVSSGETVKVEGQFTGNGVEQVKFADATVWNRTQVLDASWIRGAGSAETLNGTADADKFDGGGGNDLLIGDNSGDTYLYGVGSGDDTIRDYGYYSGADTLLLSGLNIADVSFTRSGNDLFVKIASSGEQVKVEGQFNGNGVEQVKFADNTAWDRTQVLDASWIRGTSSGETITGTSDPDKIDGGGGNDTINGGSGADTLDGGAGNDTLNGQAGGDTYLYGAGSGNDTVAENTDGSATDTVRLVGLNIADVSFGRTGENLIVTVTATGEQLTVQNQFSSTTNGIEQLVFADNTTWNRIDILLHVPAITGTSGNDTLNGTSGDNVFNGGLGNDTIRSGGGSDIHIYASGDGSDLIDEESGSTSEIDTLWFTDINAGGITLTRSGVNLMVNITATGHQLNIDEQYWSATSNWGIEQFRFADGAIWNRDTIMQNAWWNGATGNDSMSGWGSYDNIDGGAGNDTINGNAGIDRIVGGSGNDSLTGGAGNDTFMFRSGFGLDTITDFTAGAGSDDVIEIQDGLFADFAAVQGASAQVGSNVVITLDASNTITLQNVILANLHQDDFHLHLL